MLFPWAPCPAWVECWPVVKAIATAIFRGRESMAWSRVSLEEGKKGRRVGCRHSMAQGRPWVHAGQQGARGQRSKVFMCGGHWCPSLPARPFPTRPPALPSSPPACGLPSRLPSVSPSTALTPLHQLSWAAVLTLPQPPEQKAEAHPLLRTPGQTPPAKDPHRPQGRQAL